MTPPLLAKAVDDASELNGVVDHASSVVDARHGKAAARQVALRCRANVFDAKGRARFIELPHEFVERFEGGL